MVGGGRVAEAEILQELLGAVQGVTFERQHLDGPGLWMLLLPSAPGAGLWPLARTDTGFEHARGTLITTVREIC